MKALLVCSLLAGVGAGPAAVAVASSGGVDAHATAHAQRSHRLPAVAVPAAAAGNVSVTVPLVAFAPSDGLPQHLTGRAQAHFPVWVAPNAPHDVRLTVTATNARVEGCPSHALPRGVSWVRCHVQPTAAGADGVDVTVSATTSGQTLTQTYHHTG